jgi:hypothetical protein
MTSRYTGVQYVDKSNAWSARCKLKGKTHYLGLFKTEEDAAYAYKAFLSSLDRDVVAHMRTTANQKSSYRGVSWCEKKRKWKAVIQHENNKTYLGAYPTEEEAAVAYNDAAKRLKGDRANLNKIAIHPFAEGVLVNFSQEEFALMAQVEQWLTESSSSPTSLTLPSSVSSRSS